MKNKGFTLIELLAVILIIGLIATIATPAILSAINTSRDKSYKKQIELVESAAKRWAVDNKIGKTCIVNLDDLIKDGYIDEKIENPKDNNAMTGSVQIKVNGNKFEYEYQEEVNEDSKYACPKLEVDNQNT